MAISSGEPRNVYGCLLTCGQCASDARQLIATVTEAGQLGNVIRCRRGLTLDRNEGIEECCDP
jgi:hypothetical protein